MPNASFESNLDALASADAGTLVAVSSWLGDQGIACVKKEMAGVLGMQRLTDLKPCDAVRKGLATTAHEQASLLTTHRFYHAQTAMFAAEAERYTRVIAAADFGAMERFADASRYELREGLRDLLNDALVLLEQAAACVLKCPGVYGAWRTGFDMPFEIYKAAEQMTYGRYSLLTHIDRAPFVGIAILRVAIETRLRAAFRVYAYEDSANQRIVPISMTDVLAAIELHCPSAVFAVDRHDIAKIYRWSNFYLHAGRRDFIWTTGYVLQYLRPFVSGVRQPGGAWSIDNGVLVPRAEWEAVQQHFVAEAKPGRVFPVSPSADAACTIV
ncbi:hypothetical protein [Tahibacter sp.]|uniref:hypothetical protein n=1 Tax=Tahibacter sp. TaxID=2056211 RepID=UPI0028C39CC5|nr:hypothetical protein [Tahibacter sp.]